jgi:hypothetical protein
VVDWVTVRHLREFKSEQHTLTLVVTGLNKCEKKGLLGSFGHFYFFFKSQTDVLQQAATYQMSLSRGHNGEI